MKKTMNLIDISSWQSGIDLKTVFAQNDLDGVIVKATQGIGYVNPEYFSWASWLSDNGKPFGVYHYCEGCDPEDEAKHFYNAVKNYIGKAIPVADYEGDVLNKGQSWLKKFLEKFYKLSGVKCMIYCSLSVVSSLTELTDYPLWIAQYADMNPVYGFLDKPWQKGSVEPFSKYWMHQYTSSGWLDGYNSGALDLDKFYGTVEDWNALAGGSSVEPVPEPTTLKGPDPVVIGKVLDGKYGTGTERSAKLKADGYDSNKVQDKINELYAIALSCKKYINGNEEYLNPLIKIVRVL